MLLPLGPWWTTATGDRLMRGEPWASYELEDERVLALGEDCAVVAYTAHARRAERDYHALVNSTYRRTAGGWRLALHQQTPF
jgi:hypothetical protein